MFRINTYIIIICFSFISINIFAQKKDKELFSNAEYSFETEDYLKALTNYKKLLSNNPDNSNLNYKVGMCLYNQTNKKREALPFLEKAIKNISTKYKEGNFNELNAPEDALLYYGNSLLLAYRIKEAREAYQRYKGFLDVKDVANIDNADQKIYSCDIAEEMVRKKVPYVSRPLPDPIILNTPQYNIVVNKDETALAYLLEKEGKLVIYYTRKNGDKWSSPIDITNMIDVDPKFDKYKLCSMSADGERLYLKIENDLETGLFVATYKSGRWRSSQTLGGKINAMCDQTHACESVDGTQLFITSNRKGGFGNLDIYVSTLNEKGQWEKPVNLGNVINTPFNEEKPYISSDNQRLYFCSEGRQSLGGYDIFVSHRISGNEWSEPQNIGFPINTTDDDLFYVPLSDEGKAFCSLRIDTNPQVSLIDIHLLPGEVAVAVPDVLPAEVQVAAVPLLPIDTPVVEYLSDSIPIEALANDIIEDTVQGIILIDSVVAETIPTNIKTVAETLSTPTEKIMFLRGVLSFSDDSRNMELIDISILDKKKEVINTLKPAADGNYIVPLKPGTYYVDITANGYTKIEKSVHLPDSSQITEVFLNGLLQPESIKTGEYVTIRSILFNYNSILIDREGKIMLERLIRIMKDYPALSMEIIGHADSKGNPTYNRKISLDRAKAVSDYFVSRGVDPTRFVVHGFGDIISIAKNINEDGSDNPLGRRFNRRAEIRLLNCSNLKIVNEEIAIPENLRVADSYEYFVCIAESDKYINKAVWTDKIDTSLLNVSQIEQKYVCTYSAPSSKGDALLKLEELSNNFPEAYIAPQTYFTSETRKPQYSIPSTYSTSSKYTIQLVALSNYLDVSYFRNLNNVIHHKGYDGLNRYTWGNFNSFVQAYSNIRYVQRKGYTDAFVVPVSKFTGEIVKKPLTGYSVQVYSSVKEADTTMFKELPDFKLYKGIDKYYRYTTGNFETHFEAARYLQNVKKKGFPNASIRRISDLTE
jgi:outer membrane protein OmpA-like peptidoglycan-associated protein